MESLNINVTECYFVTGTDTSVGKTVVSISLLQAAQHQGRIVAGYKPVATGSKITSMGLFNDDALILQRSSSLALNYALVNPYAFAESTSPHIVSANTKQKIEFSRLTQGLRELKTIAEWVLIEGAGGWFTPLTSKQTFADWVQQENLPVILTVGIKLGCINHAILTAQAVFQAGLFLAGWVASNIAPPGRWHMEYLSTLKNVINAPFLGEIPFLTSWTEESDIWKYIDFKLLKSK